MSTLPLSMLQWGAMAVFGLIAALSAFLVMSDLYEDGVIGRFALGVMVFAAMTLAVHIRDQVPIADMVPAACTLAGAVALFLARHAFRFWRWSRSGACAWKVKSGPCAGSPNSGQGA